MPESESHCSIKKIITKKLKDWFGASIDEYYSSGHELDTFAVTDEGISIYVEVVWYHSMSQFLSDMNMLQQSDAEVKVVIGSPEVIADYKMIREFEKIVVSQRRAGKKIHGDILNGLRILEDDDYVNNNLRGLLTDLVATARKTMRKDAVLQIVSLTPVKSKWATGNLFNIVGRINCSGQRVVRRLDATLQFVSAETPVRYVSVSDNGKIEALDLAHLSYSWSPDGSDEENVRGEFPEMRQGDNIFVVFPDAVGWGYGGNGHLWWWKNLFEFTPGSKYRAKLVVRGLSGSKTITAEKDIEFAI